MPFLIQDKTVSGKWCLCSYEKRIKFKILLSQDPTDEVVSGKYLKIPYKSQNMAALD